MRLWSIHPKYLDRQGLLAVWREGLLAQKVLLQGEYKECSECYTPFLTDGGHKVYTKVKYKKEKSNHCLKCKGTRKIKTPYYNHPQLIRFKETDNPLEYIGDYLFSIWFEGRSRYYNFDSHKIFYFEMYYGNRIPKLIVTTGQLEYEFEHLQEKLAKRNPKKHKENHKLAIGANFIMNWEDYIIEPHPLFKVIEGDIESWEKIK